MCSCRRRRTSCMRTSTPSTRRWNGGTILACTAARSSSGPAWCSRPPTRQRRAASTPRWAARRPAGCAPPRSSSDRACPPTPRRARRCSRSSARPLRWWRACRSTRPSSTLAGWGTSRARRWRSPRACGSRCVSGSACRSPSGSPGPSSSPRWPAPWPSQTACCWCRPRRSWRSSTRCRSSASGAWERSRPASCMPWASAPWARSPSSPRRR